MVILNKLKEGLLAILPIYIIIMILNFTPLLTLTNNEIIAFSVAAVMAIIGISLFNVGSEVAMTKMGKTLGSSLTKKGKMSLLLIIIFVMALLLTIAEPDLKVLANQLETLINPTLILVLVGLGVGLFAMLAVLRMIFRISYSKIMIFLYALLFGLSILVIYSNNDNLIPFIMDSSGVTTGAITVPFLLSLGVGISQVIAKKSEKDMAFGLMGICSMGAIIVMLVVGIFLDSSLTYTVLDYSLNSNLWLSIWDNLQSAFLEILLSLTIIFIFFLICNFIFIKLEKKKLLQLVIGLVYTLLGLTFFLAAVETGFMPVGYRIGMELATVSEEAILIFSFIVGAVSVLAEPAIHVLVKQVNEVTSGSVSKKVLLIALIIGVGLSLVLAILRIIYDFNIMYYLVPGFMIVLLLTFFVPKVYVTIAFDSGGVAAGAMTSSFMLPLAIGACIVFQDESRVIYDAFGIVTMVALVPMIIVLLVGLFYIIKDERTLKRQVEKILKKDDEIIIKF